VKNGGPTSISQHNPSTISWLEPDGKFGVIEARAREQEKTEKERWKRCAKWSEEDPSCMLTCYMLLRVLGTKVDKSRRK
jgi:hypothetical protein